MGERQGERRRAANHLALRVVLGTVARALELVFSLVPRHDATEVRAHGVQAEVGQRTIRLDDEVRSVTLQPLREGVVARKVRLQPSGALDIVAVRILGRLTSSTTARTAKRVPSVSWIMISRTLTLAAIGAYPSSLEVCDSRRGSSIAYAPRRNKEVRITTDQRRGRKTDRADEEQVHDVALAHVGDVRGRRGGLHDTRDVLSLRDGGRLPDARAGDILLRRKGERHGESGDDRVDVASSRDPRGIESLVGESFSRPVMTQERFEKLVSEISAWMRWRESLVH